MPKFSHQVIYSIAAIILVFSAHTSAERAEQDIDFSALTNFRVHGDNMISAGLPTEGDFNKLRRYGVGRVIDLIPGDRSEERALIHSLGMEYFNVPVKWENPTLQNFKNYVHYMQVPGNNGEKILTHCKVNWRGSVFTYLYRVTQLHEDKDAARQDMLSIWQPNEVWQTFIGNVEAHYQQSPAR